MTELGTQTRLWCESALQVRGAGRILSTELLLGGLDALTIGLETQSTERFVFRSLLGSSASDASTRLRREASVLKALQNGGELPPVPQLLAVDPEGASAGLPSLLMTRLPGRADVAVESAQRRVLELARALAAIHRTTIPDGTSLPQTSIKLDARHRAPSDVGGLLNTATRDAAFSVLESLPGICRDQPRCLVHGDFHLGNALFVGQELSGIVDWGDGGHGVRGTDVGYCRADLALLMGGDLPDVFLREYERQAGTSIPHLPVWDLAGAAQAYPDPTRWAVAWRTLGRDDLDDARVHRRLDRFVQGALRRRHA